MPPPKNAGSSCLKTPPVPTRRKIPPTPRDLARRCCGEIFTLPQGTGSLCTGACWKSTSTCAGPTAIGVSADGWRRHVLRCRAHPFAFHLVPDELGLARHCDCPRIGAVGDAALSQKALDN